MQHPRFSAQDVRHRADGVLPLTLSGDFGTGEEPNGPGDHDLNPDLRGKLIDRPRPAAVLVPIINRAREAHVLLTQRTDHLPDHAGQVAFPGGKIEQHDESPLDTALRETEEEIGLGREYVNIIGFLDGYRTATGYFVYPAVGIVEPAFSLTLDRTEVAEVFEVPLGFLMNPANHQRRKIFWKGKQRRFYAMPYEGRFIWGATAGMIRNLYERLYD